MRIIKAAKKTDEVISTCFQCHSVLGVRETDINWHHSYWTYDCPVCNATNNFNVDEKSELFPWVMEEEIDDREISDSNTLRQH